MVPTRGWKGGDGEKMSTPALEAHVLSKRYGRGALALDGLELTIEPGTTTALVGPNGAGKSTLIRLWMGFERPTQGRVAVLGADPSRNRAEAVEHVGYVAQGATLYRDLTVADHLDLARSLRQRFDRAHAAERLRRLGIPSGARAGQLSGGQQAQVALALALGTRAPVLLLDEPLASLDPLARREFLAIVTEVARTEVATVLLSSHIVTDVEPACERIIVLSEGRIQIHDSVSGLRSRHWVRAAGQPPASPTAGTRVGAFPGPAGEPLELWTTTASTRDGLRPAALEEVVIGYLAAQRTPLP